jgi:TrmH family RNA methyltransferase
VKTYKKDCDISYSIGVYPTLELLRARPECVNRVLISSRGAKNSGARQIEALCHQRHIRVEVADRAVEKLAGCANAYVVGEFGKYATPLQHDNHVVLINPSDSGNLGTILRTALAFDVTNLTIVRPAVDVFDPKVIRASMGAVFRLNFAYVGAFEAYRDRFDNQLYPFMTDGRTPLPQATFRQPFALIFGSEGGGLSAAFHEVGESIRIPQSAAVDSLNLAVAVGIGLYASQIQKQP